MASSTVPTLELDGRNWKVFQVSLLEAAATKGWLGILSGQETNDESLRWEGKDSQLKMLFYQTVPIPLILKIQKLRMSHEMFNYLATKFRDPTPISVPNKKPVEASSDGKMQESHTKPEELSVEPPSEERLKDILTEASSEEEAEAAVGAAQQTLSQSIKVEENLPELHEQLSSRARKPPKSEHIEVLDGIVKKLGEVESVDRKACEDLPMKPCNRSTKNDLPDAQELLLEGSRQCGTLQWLTASSQEVENSKSVLSMPTGHAGKVNSCMRQHIPKAQRVPLEGELAGCVSNSTGHTSSNKKNLQGHTKASRAPGMCAEGTSGREEPIDLLVNMPKTPRRHSYEAAKWRHRRG
ncbi:hypothetical protein EV401DRAFT_1893343 [Pisolithus croceorrhizus]|nr:hypothetical protein EV401DRAFT_1893343 [Pisolithus croceorrhizus]